MHRHVALLVVVVITALVGAGVAAQSKNSASRWTPPRTPDGHPALQGIWINATIPPFERPPTRREKAVLPEAEAAAFERQASPRREEDGPPRPGDVGSYNQFWFDSGDRV